MAVMNPHRRNSLFILSLLLAHGLVGPARDAAAAGGSPGFQRWELTVDGAARETLVYAPPSAKEKATPVVFVFHGHGGNSRNAARSFALNQHWPEAISVYPQGLNTPGRLTDPEGKKAGWQHGIGEQGDRDLAFFDAVLARLNQEYKVDGRRIYSTGHSNGGGFTYLLWAARADVFAAVAPSAAGAARSLAKLKPKPAMHLAGEKDPLVKFEWQKATMDAVRRLNDCESVGKPWDRRCTLYTSKSGTPFVTFIHAGGHEFHRDAPALIVKFFKEHPAVKE
jgi:polyhydroxybutyrate depolymerase